MSSAWAPLTALNRLDRPTIPSTTYNKEPTISQPTISSTTPPSTTNPQIRGSESSIAPRYGSTSHNVGGVQGGAHAPLLQHMADHYRIPSVLPTPPTKLSTSSLPSASTVQQLFQANLLQDYLAMLSNKPETQTEQSTEAEKEAVESAVKSMLGQGMSSLKHLHPKTMADLVSHHRRLRSSTPSPPAASKPAQPVSSSALPISPSYQAQQQLSPPQQQPLPQITQTQYLTSPYENGYGDDFGTSPMLSDAVASPYSPYADEFATSPYLSDTSPYLTFADTTSPLMDTPLLSFEDEYHDEFQYNTGPVDDSPLSADLNTPVMEAIDDTSMDLYSTTNPQSALFNDAAVEMYDQIEEIDIVHKGKEENAVKQEMMTPDTKPLSSFPPPISLRAPFASTMTTAKANANRRASSIVPTGTRRNLTPQSLIPYDAPTQTRRYITPSATSKKEVPTAFIRKRKRLNSISQPQNDSGEDELDEPLEPLHPNPTEAEAIEHKRRQNTLAARKSRKRKLEHVLKLENDNEELKLELEMWKERASALARIVKAYGIADVDVENM
ncbi:hypothetical protein PQX77_001474 [Marasmius sp. AFHP31]|nr:hypothetical protein PQX77_001474 [Marasmius sp. AFHP31]